MSSDIKSKTFKNDLSAATAAIAALQTTSGTAAMTLTAAAGTGAFHSTDQAAKVTLTSGGNTLIQLQGLLTINEIAEEIKALETEIEFDKKKVQKQTLNQK